MIAAPRAVLHSLAQAGPSARRGLTTAAVVQLSRTLRPSTRTSRRPSSSTHLPSLPTQRHASTAPLPQSPQGTPIMVGAQLRTSVETELDALRDRIAGFDGIEHTWLRPLNGDETALVNMGQVPGAEGAEVICLLDLDLQTPMFDRDRDTAGPAGTGVHVPLLPHMGSTEPAVPCYPFLELFGKQAPRVAERVRAAVASQRGKGGTGAISAERGGEASLVALVVPGEGEKRDTALPLALALFRLAMHEGNGHDEMK